jgi:signal transduction histidine kinase
LESLSIEVIVQKALTLLCAQMPLEKIKVISGIPAGLPQAMLDRDQLMQVFINLFQNAVQAMPDGGELSIRCYTKVFDQKGNGVGSRAADMFRLGETALVSEVRDTGMGIPSDKIQKVFEPFFTTKPRGEGTGLGLAITKSIVDAHRGLISVTSEPGRGTTFTLSFHIAS